MLGAGLPAVCWGPYPCCPYPRCQLGLRVRGGARSGPRTCRRVGRAHSGDEEEPHNPMAASHRRPGAANPSPTSCRCGHPLVRATSKKARPCPGRRLPVVRRRYPRAIGDPPPRGRHPAWGSLAPRVDRRPDDVPHVPQDTGSRSLLSASASPALPIDAPVTQGYLDNSRSP
jgi:hypothetical protein